MNKNYKTKEYAVIEFIIKNFPREKYTWIENKKIQDGCSRKLPDLLLDLGYQIIIVEIDENRHDSYECICENKRLMEISRDLQHRSIIFIRFNPDKYIDINGTEIPSCWKANMSGIHVIHDKYN